MANTSLLKMFSRAYHSSIGYSLRQDKFTLSCALIFLLLVLLALLAPWISPFDPYDPMTIDIMNSEYPPIWVDGADTQFLLGTDAQGRDLLSTILYGMRISLVIGICAVLLQAFLGIIFGLTAGYFGGRIDTVLMRVADIQLSYSTMMVAIIVLALFQAAFGAELYSELAVLMLILVIGFAEWPQYARTVRASVLAEKKKEYGIHFFSRL